METQNFLNTKIISDVTYDTAIAPVMILVLLFKTSLCYLAE